MPVVLVKAGPGRPWHGAVRDAVLGVRLLNGRAETLTFGGQVMKNVAGYDVSRLVAGAWGALGVILEVSMRVAPQWQTQQTLCFSMAAPEAVQFCRDIARRYLPISGTWWADDCLYLRLSGTHAAVQSASPISRCLSSANSDMSLSQAGASFLQWPHLGPETSSVSLSEVGDRERFARTRGRRISRRRTCPPWRPRRSPQ